MPHRGDVVGVLGIPWCCSPIPLALGSTNETPPSTARDAAEVLHLNVDQWAKVVVLVTADRFTGEPTTDREPVQSTGSQDPADRGRVFTVEL